MLRVRFYRINVRVIPCGFTSASYTFRAETSQPPLGLQHSSRYHLGLRFRATGENVVTSIKVYISAHQIEVHRLFSNLSNSLNPKVIFRTESFRLLSAGVSFPNAVPYPYPHAQGL